jgi:hypothetical protein
MIERNPLMGNRPYKVVRSTSGCQPLPPSPLYPAIHLILKVAMTPESDRSAIRQHLNAIGEHLDTISQSLTGETLRRQPGATGEQPDGIYQYVLTTYDAEAAETLANLLATLSSSALGKNTVRVVVTSVNETLCEIAA